MLSWNILQHFWPAKAIFGLENQFLIFFLSGRLRQVLLYDQEMPEEQIKDQPMAPRGRNTEYTQSHDNNITFYPFMPIVGRICNNFEEIVHFMIKA